MKKIQFKKELLIGLAVIFVFLALLMLFFTSANKTQVQTTPETLEADFSKLNLLKPGESTAEDVTRINGKPNETEVVGNKTYYYYYSPIGGIKNKVLIQNNTVVYALENIFGNYRGTYSNYVKSFGEPDLILYENSGYSFPWYVFFENGAMIQSTNDVITGIVYFVPQKNQEEFFKNIGEDLGFSADNLEDKGEAILGPE